MAGQPPVAEIAFFVHGTPAPQGSKTRTRWGLREDNPNTRPWREAVGWSAAAARGDGSLLAGPVAADLHFTFPRPKGHYGTGRNSNIIKATAPRFHAQKPDIDKLCRAVLDSLTGVLIVDDSSIAVLTACKTWGDENHPPGVRVRLWGL